jgi:hypothetical protein
MLSDLASLVMWEQGAGGLPGLSDAQNLLSSIQAQMGRVAPRLQTLMSQPGAEEMGEEMRSALTQRFIARTIKAVLGPSSSAAERAKLASSSNFARVSDAEPA